MNKLRQFVNTCGFIALGIIAIIGIAHLVPGPRIKPGIWWNEYHATVDGWNINISESEDEGEVAFRMVHLKAVTNSLWGITGYSGLTGGWTRIFWCGMPSSTNGCNSYVRTKNGWRWEPCRWDASMTPIPESEIAKAINLLDAAMTNRVIENISIVWTRGSTTYLTRK